MSGLYRSGGGGGVLNHGRPSIRVLFDPLKCIARLNVQCKRDWCVEKCTLRTQEDQGFAPPPL